MNTITEKLSATVREGYQVLLRAEAELILPQEKEIICNYYRILVDKCMTWATDVYGEALRREFLSLEDLHDRALFRAQKYRFLMRIPWEGNGHAALLCESYLLGQRKPKPNSYHRLSHVWNLEEETILPLTQVLTLLGANISLKDLPFRPDGIYPEGQEIVFYKNPTPDSPLQQGKSPFGRETDEGKGK